MLKSVLKNSLIYTLSSVLSKGISFFLLPLYTAILSSQDYGILELIAVITTLVIIIFSLQINQGIARYFNELRTSKVTRIYSSTVFIFGIITFSLLFLLGVFFKPLISHYLEISEWWTSWVLVALAMNGLFYITRSQLTWKIMALEDTISGLAFSLTTIGSTIYFLVFANQGLLGVFMAQCIGGGIGILVCVYFLRHDLGMYFSLKVIKKLLSFSLPLIPSAFSIFLFLFLDRICIKEMMTLHDLGVYSVGFKVASILSLVSIGIGTALTPLIYKHYKEVETPKKMGQLMRIYSSGAFIIILTIVIFSQSIILAMTTSDYLDAVRIIPVLIFSLYVSNLNQFFPGLFIAKKTKTISVIALFAGMVNLILNVLLIPRIGLMGAALATIISYSINSGLIIFAAQKKYMVDVAGHNVLIVGVIIALFSFFYSNFQYADTIEFRYKMLGLILCSIMVVFTVLTKTDLITIRDKFYLFKSKSWPM